MNSTTATVPPTLVRPAEHRRVADLRDHEAAAVVPMMTAAEYSALRDDPVEGGRVKGVQDPLDILPDGRVLDGRHRLRAAREAGVATVPVRVLDLEDDQAAQHVYRTAVLRRHLNDDQRVTSARQKVYGDRRADPEGKVMSNVLSIPRVTRDHPERIDGFPTQLPIDLLRLVVGCASDPGDRVLELFSGSAPAGVACIEQGRCYRGIEKNPEYVRLSRQRLAAWQAGPAGR
jgi:hypothetical protein